MNFTLEPVGPVPEPSLPEIHDLGYTYLNSDATYYGVHPAAFAHVSRQEAVRCHLAGHGAPTPARRLKCNGQSKIILLCGTCGAVLDDRGAPFRDHPNYREYPVVKDLVDHTPCEHCGATDGVECHHWAPSSLFYDSGDWPTALLCSDCHRLWHRTMDSREPIPDPREVAEPCGTCNARPNEPCRTENGNPTAYSHLERCRRAFAGAS